MSGVYIHLFCTEVCTFILLPILRGFPIINKLKCKIKLKKCWKSVAKFQNLGFFFIKNKNTYQIVVFVFVTYKVVAVIFVPEPHNLIGKFKGGGKVLPHKQKLSVLVSVKHLNWSECEFSSGCLPATTHTSSYHHMIILVFLPKKYLGNFFGKKLP